MKRNVADLPAVPRLGERLGATRFVVSNVLPHTQGMCQEALHPHVLELPKMDVGQITRKSLYEVMRAGLSISSFEFSPCAACGGCDLSETNEEHCRRNPFPTRGGCLWAQGLIQCP